MAPETRTWRSKAKFPLEDVDKTDGLATVGTWFCTEPLSRDFCARVCQLQLWTDSHDDPVATPAEADKESWTWFELAIFADANATTPVERDDVEFVWKSHSNKFSTKDHMRHYGIVFDRRGDLLNKLEPGNVIGVRVCANGRTNMAESAELKALVLDIDLFSSADWTLGSETVAGDIPAEIPSGIYTVSANTECHLATSDDPSMAGKVFSRMWFTSPVLDKQTIDKIQDVQLTTVSRDQGFCDNPSAGNYSWFDVAILEGPDATEPLVVDGRALVWQSHFNDIGCDEYKERRGRTFDRDHEMLGLLKEGNVIGVIASARFIGWENNGKEGHLLVRIANDPLTRHIKAPTVDYKALLERREVLKKEFEAYQKAMTAPDQPPAYEDIAFDLSQPLRADADLGVGNPPLRLLALDGGGVKGISTLVILQQIMKKVTGKDDARPCEYFDMMAGTSTGGLIAIMLGRLRMTVGECISKYEALSSKIFGKTQNLMTTGVKYDAAALEKEISALVGGSSMPMLDPNANACKVFVVATKSKGANNAPAELMRTYVRKNALVAPGTTILEAARATSAAPTYFKQMNIGGEDFIDGGLVANNPIVMLIVEAESYFGPARPKICTLSLGTGMQPNVNMPTVTGLSRNFLSNMTAVAELGTYKDWMPITTSQEHAHNEVVSDSRVAGSYFRFNLERKNAKGEYETIGLDDYKRMNEFREWTIQWLSLKEQQAMTDECAKRLKPSATVLVKS